MRWLLKRKRSRAPSRHAHHRVPHDESSNPNNDILNKFLDIQNVNSRSNSKLSLHNVIPEFDPMSKEHTIITWLTKVEECAEIYHWDEREIIHFALPKLTGLAKQWYQGLIRCCTLGRGGKESLESFQDRQDHAELFNEMLNKHARYGKSLEQYFYTKINLLNRCGIASRKSVDCLLNGV